GRAMAVVGGVIVLAALARFFIEQPVDGRLNGFGQLDTHVVAALIYGVVLIFNIEILLTEKSPWWRLFALVSALLVVCAVFLSDSRNAWVSVIAGASIYLFSHRARDPRQFALGILVIGLIIAVVLAGLWVNEETKDIVLPRGDSFRIFIWQATLERLDGLGLIFGLGITTNDDVQVNNLLFEHPHNMYLALLFQGGLFAFVLFWVVVVGCLRVLLRQYHRNDAKLALGILALALLSYLLDGHELVDKVGETWFLFWLPVGLSLGLRWSEPTLRH
ncbi:MAG: O-antigen ligase family protein, partial [Pseudomonadales bacterium]